MNPGIFKDIRTDAHRSRIVIASLLLIVGSLLPTIEPVFGKMTWYWQNFHLIPYRREYLSATFLQFCSFLSIFVPLLLCKYLNTRQLVIAILVTMFVFSLILLLRFPQTLKLVGIRQNQQTFHAILATPIIYYAFILLGIGSRLALALPSQKYPLVIMRVASSLLLAIIVIILFSKVGKSSNYVIEIFFDSSMWQRAPMLLLYAITFPIVVFVALSSSFKEISPKVIAPMIYGLVAFTVIVLMKLLIDKQVDLGVLHFVVFVKVAILIYANVCLLSSSLYSSCYIFTKE